ncbi:MAG: four helix bundle protein [Algoriphagus sp.]|jgi:four helix bundle protein|uniref:four helix bundle protein n=1 Tax=Algoriphagus sp. TaxID=1872435 RepID=UPI00260352FF|nr:four helix bundle protein [Algoriphagus sp.]MDG1278564.1 four helix bundle protein [Algoriphagus sp.]
MTAKSFEELVIWQKAISIGVDIYSISDQLPLKNDYKSRDQLIGSAVSISNNIAEGFEYNNRVQFIRFLGYAKGSAGELRSQLALLVKVNRVSEENYMKLKEELIGLSRQIKSLIEYLKTKKEQK